MRNPSLDGGAPRWRLLPFRFLLLGPVLILAAGACNAPVPEPPDDPPEVALGERLFLETRFAQFFAAHADDVNHPLAVGDPVMDELETTGAPRPGPFAGKSMNCRQCHLVDDSPDARDPALGVLTYGDFARRSPVPDRGDGRTHTPRNSPPLVNALVARDVPLALHFDGQFSSPEELVEATLTGRNFGWLPGEGADAVAHVARVIRGDDGSDALAAACHHLPYATILGGASSAIPAACRLPEAYRIEVAAAADTDVLQAVARLMAAYMRKLTYTRHVAESDGADSGATDGPGASVAAGPYTGSPYDRFLILNGLPRQPRAGETALDYARRLRAALAALPTVKLLDNPAELSFTHHLEPFAFGADALAGLRVFLAEPASAPAPDSAAVPASQGGTGNCVACHTPPDFSDFGFHNNGTAQAEYDAIHGDGSFGALDIPDLARRQADPDSFLPASALTPMGMGPFLDPPSQARPGHADLGLWNVFANPAVPGPQSALSEVVADVARRDGSAGIDAELDAASLLPLTIARFKTATLRDLGQSAPYFHNGSADTLADAARHYQAVAALARAGSLRNGAPELGGIALGEDDIAALAAFLRSLDEDYE